MEFIHYNKDLLTFSILQKNNINSINYIEKNDEIYYLQLNTNNLYKYNKNNNIITFIDDNVDEIFDVVENVNSLW